MKTKIAEEGSVRVRVPDPEGYRTPSGDYAPSLTDVFYNPQMEFCRDLSISVAQVLAGETGGLRVCDPLAGVGIRGVRYAKEVEGIREVVINDRSRAASELVLQNIDLNAPAVPVSVEREDANVLMLKNRGRFNYIDLDPFGSPAKFVDAACASIARRGMIALTATDTGPLCGSHPRACVRRYGAIPLRTEYCHELGIRILVGFCQRVAGKHELALEPVLVHSTRHYFRVYLRAKRSASATDAVLEKLGYVSHCFSCGRRFVSSGLPAVEKCVCGSTPSRSGPLWTGVLWEREFLEKVIADLSIRNFRNKGTEVRVLLLCLEESGGPPTFYDVNRLASMTGSSPPRMKRLLDRLREIKRFASRTHFSPVGFRTDAAVEELTSLF